MSSRLSDNSCSVLSHVSSGTSNLVIVRSNQQFEAIQLPFIAAWAANSAKPRANNINSALMAMSAVRTVTFGSLFRIHDSCPGAVRHGSIRMCNDRHNRHSSGECEGQREN